jgi:hypothetical protein
MFHVESRQRRACEVADRPAEHLDATPTRVARALEQAIETK